jgi:hypothetical protein
VAPGASVNGLVDAHHSREALIVDVFADVDGLGALVGDAQLVAQVQIDGRGPDFARVEGVDDDVAGIDLRENRVVRENHRRLPRFSSAPGA